MAGSLNKVQLIGRLGADPEIKQMVNGKSVARLSIATSQSWKDKSSGERKEKTEWHRVVIFNENLGRIAEQYLRKGSNVYVEGQLQTRKWTDQQGTEKYTTEVVLSRFKGELTLLGNRGDMQQISDEGTQTDPFHSSQEAPQLNSSIEQSQISGQLPPMNDLDDGIPF